MLLLIALFQHYERGMVVFFYILHKKTQVKGSVKTEFLPCYIVFFLLGV